MSQEVNDERDAIVAVKAAGRYPVLVVWAPAGAAGLRANASRVSKWQRDRFHAGARAGFGLTLKPPAGARISWPSGPQTCAILRRSVRNDCGGSRQQHLIAGFVPLPWQADRQRGDRSFNGRPHEGCLNTHWFESIDDAKEKVDAWSWDYDEHRPHRSLAVCQRGNTRGKWKQAPQSHTTRFLVLRPGQWQVHR